MDSTYSTRMFISKRKIISTFLFFLVFCFSSQHRVFIHESQAATRPCCLQRDSQDGFSVCPNNTCPSGYNEYNDGVCPTNNGNPNNGTCYPSCGQGYTC